MKFARRALRFVALSVLVACMVVAVSGCSQKPAEKQPPAAQPAQGQQNQPAPQQSGSGSKQRVSLGTGNPGGQWYLAGSAIAKVLNEKLTDVILIPEVPPSAIVTVKNLSSGDYQIGLSGVDYIKFGAEGNKDAGYDKPAPGVKALCGGSPSVQAWVVAKNSKIKAFDKAGIEGARFACANAGIHRMVAFAAMKIAGIDSTKVKDWKFMSYKDEGEALKDGHVDIITESSFPAQSTLSELAVWQNGFRFVGLTEEQWAKFDKENPWWASLTIPKGTYKGIDEDARGFTTWTVLAANEKISDELAYKVTKAVIENNADLVAVYPGMKDFTVEQTKMYLERGILKPEDLHPGAAKYWKEKGVLK